VLTVTCKRSCPLLAAAIVYATIPDENALIHGCYLKGTGLLRVIDAAKNHHCT
jgi:hypothetical protein